MGGSPSTSTSTSRRGGLVGAGLIAGGGLLLARGIGFDPRAALASVAGVALVALGFRRLRAARGDSAAHVGPPEGRPRLDLDLVQEAGIESFPASDAPSWSPTSAGSPQRR